MRAKVHRGRIRILLEDPDQRAWLHQRERIVEMIGSTSIQDDTLPQVSCALSVQNFRKLRELGCKLHGDPHTRDVVERLRTDVEAYRVESARGDDVKAGRVLYANYKFKAPPYTHQVLGFQFLHSMATAALFGDCGTGKTFIVSTFADSLIKAGEKWAFLVLCPVNLIKHVWMLDVAKFTDLSCVGLREPTTMYTIGEDWDEPGDPEVPSEHASRHAIQERASLRASRRQDPKARAKAKRRAQARQRKKIAKRFAQDVDVYILNPENLRTDAKEKRVRDLLRRKTKEGFQCAIVIDESSKIKSRTSRTYKAIKRLRSLCDRCIIMTGTPSPNGVLDLWAQFSVLDGGKTLQPSYVDYRRDTCREIVLKGVTWEDGQGNTHNAKKWAPQPGAALRVYKMIQPRMIRFRTEDCIDLPPKRFLIRDVEMSADQVSSYEEMEEMLFTELEGEPVTARVAATKLLKLRQITGGFLMTDDREAVPIGKHTPKMLELDQLLSQSVAKKMGDDEPPVKGLVWAQYQWECKSLVARYQREYGARGLFGGISTGARDEALRRFKEDPRCQLLVCHPGSAGHGLTLTEANFSFYYSLSYNFEEFYQSYRRITRPGQTRSMTFYFLVCPGTIDEELLTALENKKNLSDLVTDGAFNREDFVKRRGKDRVAQLRLEWEVPDGT